MLYFPLTSLSTDAACSQITPTPFICQNTPRESHLLWRDTEGSCLHVDFADSVQARQNDCHSYERMRTEERYNFETTKESLWHFFCIFRQLQAPYQVFLPATVDQVDTQQAVQFPAQSEKWQKPSCSFYQSQEVLTKCQQRVKFVSGQHAAQWSTNLEAKPPSDRKANEHKCIAHDGQQACANSVKTPQLRHTCKRTNWFAVTERHNGIVGNAEKEATFFPTHHHHWENWQVCVRSTWRQICTSCCRCCRRNTSGNFGFCNWTVSQSLSQLSLDRPQAAWNTSPSFSSQTTFDGPTAFAAFSYVHSFLQNKRNQFFLKKQTKPAADPHWFSLCPQVLSLHHPGQICPPKDWPKCMSPKLVIEWHNSTRACNTWLLLKLCRGQNHHLVRSYQHSFEERNTPLQVLRVDSCRVLPFFILREFLSGSGRKQVCLHWRCVQIIYRI